ncbi:MAG: hypothetical protein KDA60_04240, partial [Planctomycetales bacterium]|nr:hypothetical protein [Planctomycetales bacterium]
LAGAASKPLQLNSANDACNDRGPAQQLAKYEPVLRAARQTANNFSTRLTNFPTRVSALVHEETTSLPFRISHDLVVPRASERRFP